jgi:hypothetical protein
MSIVSTRYAAPGGGITYRLAEVLSEYPSLGTLRVRILATGHIRHINRASIAWALMAQGGDQ